MTDEQSGTLITESLMQGASSFSHTTRLFTKQRKNYAGRKRTFPSKEDKIDYEQKLIDRDLAQLKHEFKVQGFKWNEVLAKNVNMMPVGKDFYCDHTDNNDDDAED